MTTPIIKIGTEGVEPLEFGLLAEIRRCWTCGSCDFECPVNIATGRLWPRKILRMAALGMLPELLDLPSIWYCQSCLRCARICPSTVSPAAVIACLRTEKIRRDDIPQRTVEAYHRLWGRFQRVRWQAAAICLEGGELGELTDATWRRWLNTSIKTAKSTIAGRMDGATRRFTQKLNTAYHTNNCHTCGECSSGCPVAGSKHVFDPRTLFRMVNLGLYGELLKSPSIWLCLACRRCTACCSQKVDGLGLIQALQNLALSKDTSGRSILYHLEQANKIIYKRLLLDINQLFSTSPPTGRQACITLS